MQYSTILKNLLALQKIITVMSYVVILCLLCGVDGVALAMKTLPNTPIDKNELVLFEKEIFGDFTVPFVDRNNLKQSIWSRQALEQIVKRVESQPQEWEFGQDRQAVPKMWMSFIRTYDMKTEKNKINLRPYYSGMDFILCSELSVDLVNIFGPIQLGDEELVVASKHNFFGKSYLYKKDKGESAACMYYQCTQKLAYTSNKWIRLGEGIN